MTDVETTISRIKDEAHNAMPDDDIAVWGDDDWEIAGRWEDELWKAFRRIAEDGQADRTTAEVWAVFAPGGSVCEDTVRSHEELSKNKEAGLHGCAWPDLYRRGYRCRRVTISWTWDDNDQADAPEKAQEETV